MTRSVIDRAALRGSDRPNRVSVRPVGYQGKKAVPSRAAGRELPSASPAWCLFFLIAEPGAARAGESVETTNRREAANDAAAACGKEH